MMVDIFAVAPRGGGNPSAAANAFALVVASVITLVTIYVVVFYLLKVVPFEKMLNKLILSILIGFDEDEGASFQEIIDKFSQKNSDDISSDTIFNSVQYLVAKGYVVKSQRHIGFEAYEDVYSLTEAGRVKVKSILD